MGPCLSMTEPATGRPSDHLGPLKLPTWLAAVVGLCMPMCIVLYGSGSESGSVWSALNEH